MAILQKYLKSERVPEEALNNLDTFCKEQQGAWTAVVAKISELLKE